MIVLVLFTLTALIFTLTRGSLKFISSYFLLLPVFILITDFLLGSHIFASWIKWVPHQGSGSSGWGYYQDTLTSFMLLLVIFVFVIVCLFSQEYVGGDPSLMLFISYLFFFLFIYVSISYCSLRLTNVYRMGRCGFMFLFIN